MDKFFTVEWRIDLYADSPEAAARKALAIQRDPDSIATVFHVTPNEGDRSVGVDVDLGPDDRED